MHLSLNFRSRTCSPLHVQAAGTALGVAARLAAAGALGSGRLALARSSAAHVSRGPI